MCPLSSTVTLTLKLVFYPCSFSTSSVYIRKLRVRGKRGNGPRKECYGAENDFESDRGFTVNFSTYQTAGLLANMLLLRPSVILICKMGTMARGTSQPGGRSQWNDKMPSTEFGTQSMLDSILTAPSQDS